MQILDFIEKTDLSKQNECEKAKLLCFYHYKETGTTVFSMTLISELMINSGYNAPNTSRLKDKLTAIEEIDKTIDHLRKTKAALISSENNLRLANNKADELSIKKLTKNAPSVKAMFDSLNQVK